MPYFTKPRMRADFDRGISRVVSDSGATGALTSSRRTGAGDEIPSGENLTFGTLANRSKPAETQASSRYHPLRSHH
jgi:hypothetical protein